MKNIKIINKKSFLYLSLCVFLAIIITYTKLPLNLNVFLSNMFTSFSLPSILISFSVLKDLDKVKNQFKIEEQGKNIFDRRSSLARDYFYQHYLNEGRIDIKSLQKQLKQIITSKNKEFSDEYFKEIQNNSFKINSSIKEFPYIKENVIYIENIVNQNQEESLKPLQECYSFKKEDLNEISKLLSSFEKGDPSKIKDLENCLNLRDLLYKLFNFEEFLIHEIEKDINPKEQNKDSEDIENKKESDYFG